MSDIMDSKVQINNDKISCSIKLQDIENFNKNIENKIATKLFPLILYQ